MSCCCTAGALQAAGVSTASNAVDCGLSEAATSLDAGVAAASPAEPLPTCPVCFDEVPPEQLSVKLLCSHVTCDSCWKVQAWCPASLVIVPQMFIILHDASTSSFPTCRSSMTCCLACVPRKGVDTRTNFIIAEQQLKSWVLHITGHPEGTAVRWGCGQDKMPLYWMPRQSLSFSH